MKIGGEVQVIDDDNDSSDDMCSSWGSKRKSEAVLKALEEQKPTDEELEAALGQGQN